MASEIHIGDIGTIFQITIVDQNGVVDLTNVDSKVIIFQRPDNGGGFQVQASLVTDGSDGLIKYVTQSGDLNQAGTWQIQGRITFGTDVFSTDIQKFKVYRNLI